MSKRKEQAAATREALLSAAAEVFAERGYRGTTVGAVTARADTAHGTFYLYFRNKEDAFGKVVERVALEVYDHTWSVPQRGSSREVIEGTLRGFLEVFVRHAGIWRCLLEGAVTTPAVEATWRELRIGFVARIARTLDQLQDAGRVRDDLDTLQVANALGSMVEWTATTQLVLAMGPRPTTLEETLATLTDLWYHALFGVQRATR